MIKAVDGWAILIPITEEEQKTKGGIVVPDAPLMASPLGVGKLIDEDTLVVYQKNAGQVFHHQGQALTFIPNSAIVGCIGE